MVDSGLKFGHFIIALFVLHVNLILCYFRVEKMKLLFAGVTYSNIKREGSFDAAMGIQILKFGL